MGSLLVMHGPRLYRTVLVPRVGVTTAKEVLSEVYVRTANTIHRFVWQPSGLYPYMKTIAVRLVIDEFRRRKRSPLWAPEDVEEAWDKQAPNMESENDERQAQQAQLSAAMQALHPRYAEVIRLRIIEEKSREDVSVTMRVSVATLDVLLCRATKALKQALESQQAETKATP